ncbi:MAG: APH(3') family aminoglycoside O-phosphotransferase [Aestuariivirga sp.]
MVPPALQSIIGGYTWLAAKDGLSGADVFELQAEGRPRLFVKTEKCGLFNEVADEAGRLAWLSSTGMPCPDVLAYLTDQDRSWLVMTAIAGEDLGSTPALPPAAVVEIAAGALAKLHRINPASCPFDHSASKRVEIARARMAAGLVDEDDFDEARQGRSAAELFDILLREVPDHEDLVVTHGDACLSNLMAEHGMFTGFIDIGRLGVADRHQDLALIARDIATNFGTHWVEPFFRRYGYTADPAKLAFFQLMDEFF